MRLRRTARYAGRRPKTFITVFGPVTLERAYYHCDACRTGEDTVSAARYTVSVYVASGCRRVTVQYGDSIPSTTRYGNSVYAMPACGTA